MTGENIICFAKDWEEDPTSNNHVMTELAKENRVLWLNSISTRTPDLGSARDIKKIFRKLGSLAKGVVQVRKNLWVYTPIVLPFPHSRWAKSANSWILRATFNVLRRRLGMRDFQLWTFLPNTAEYIGRMGESVSVYYCVDEWSKFNYVDSAQTAAAEQQLVRKVDAVFAVSQTLVDPRKTINPETHLARHGVDHKLFAKALDEATSVPDDLAAIGHPILGFYGTLQDWVDLGLISRLAERHPEWSIVLIGKPMIDLSPLKRYPNVHLLGRRPHAQLPAYCKGFAVALIPYVLHERILHVNPIKLREYISAGLPVVSVDLPEAAPYRSVCTIARTYDEFEFGVAEALRTDSPEQRVARCALMQTETWAARVADVSSEVMRVKRAKSGAKEVAQR